MSENNYNKITLNQLDCESIAEYIIETRKVVFRNGDDEVSGTNAQDVDKVSGIDSDKIAIAISNEDRTTVNNALNLGGRPASEFMTETSGNSIALHQNTIKKLYGEDIQDLRDELYQLKNELMKSGLIKYDNQYEGFIDKFRSGKYENIQGLLGTASSQEGKEIYIEDDTLFKSIDELDYICLKNPANNSIDVKQVASKKEDEKVLVLDSNIRPIVESTNMEVYKSNGIIHDGLYKFASEASTQESSEEYHTGLSDDTYNVVKRITEPKKGFAYSFRIPEAKQGFLKNFEICAKAYGSPNTLNCYIIDERDVDKFLNPVQARDSYNSYLNKEDTNGIRFFASSTYTLDPSQGKRYIKFDFTQANGKHPLMTRDDENPVRYVAIITAMSHGTDNSNYVDILFLQSKNLGDLELNNTLYNYVEQSNDSTHLALSTDEEINKFDMYYHITTVGIIENEPEPLSQGLYSAHCSFDNLKRNGFGAGKARLVLRIRREGEYIARPPSSENNIPVPIINKDLLIENENPANNIRAIADLGLKTERKKPLQTRTNESETTEKVPTIIGNNITKVEGADESTSRITTQTPILVKDGDKVYRMAYVATLKARHVSWDKETGLYDNEKEYVNYIMPLTEVIKDIDLSTREYSDKLIFECDLKNDTENPLNDFELQLFWENQDLLTSNYIDIKRSSMGAIKDLVLSFTRNF